jgi:hypothetical protein
MHWPNKFKYKSENKILHKKKKGWLLVVDQSGERIKTSLQKGLANRRKICDNNYYCNLLRQKKSRLSETFTTDLFTLGYRNLRIARAHEKK